MIPSQLSYQFKKFFAEFDQVLNRLNMRSYGISVPTLEDVFLRVTNEKNKSVKPGSEESQISNDEHEEMNPSHDIEQNNEPLTEIEKMA